MVISEFQVALLGAGVVAVAAVWVYNLWQERRHRQLADKVFKGRQPDALLPGEEAAGPEDIPMASPAASSQERIEPTLVGAAPSPAPMAGTTATAPPPATAAPEFPLQWADALVDGLVRFEFPQPVEPAALIARRDESAGGSKTEHWLASAEPGGPWRLLESNDRTPLRHGVAAIQLADRRGALDAASLQAFLSRVEATVAAFDGRADLPDAEHVLQQATALDAFCASVDIQLGIGVVGDTPLPGTKLRGLCEASGMKLVPEGVFLMRDAAGCERFGAADLGGGALDAERLRGALAGLTLSLDVPRTADGQAAFDQMLAAARQIARGLDARMVDGQRAPLSDDMIAAIRAKLGELQQQMRGQGIVPGGTRAHRLFS